MIFAARGVLVSLAFFAVLYSLLSVLLVALWRGLESLNNRSFRSAGVLFGLRIAPFLISTVVTIFFALPSFWLMERHTLDEDGETFFLALCALIVLGAGLLRVLRAHAKTSYMVARWAARSPTDGATKLSAANGAPPLILVGIRKPSVMISDAATSLLGESELKVAVRHELGHMRSRDNLKKVVLSAIPFPGMRPLDKAWQEAAEFAADDAAVTNRQEALDLAAALIKLSKSTQVCVEPALATGLVSGSSSIGPRVERLLEWRNRRAQRGWRWMSLFALAMLVCLLSNYGATLVLTHRLTELLVP